ncbi:nucleotidyl transferase AbiEii/AbiGii toxin family protein [Kiritimatiellaeota bacterium B1221]|nr:nucleotidyl transferase AbiEii/AbiGii toxin family protein [Kiritimatiellaeota bacterium B1221]
MKKVASLSADERNELFTLTAERLNIGSVAVVEKDFWVCWTLKCLFEHPTLSRLLIFKGGTSLSKVYGLIDRFSEDIDLILDWQVVTDADPMAERSKTGQGKLNEAVNKQACQYISETLVPFLDEALGSHCSVEVSGSERDLGHIVRVRYPETTAAGNLLPYIQLEIGPLASWLPHSDHTVRPYAAGEFPAMFDDADCPVRAIDAHRTFWEKATILHHEAHRPETSAIPVRYSRHYYDLYLMSQEMSVKSAALGDLEMLASVVVFKKKFYPRGWAKYDLAKPGTLRLIPPKRILNVMRQDYRAMGEMIFGRHPSWEEIVQGLSELENEINSTGESE